MAELNIAVEIQGFCGVPVDLKANLVGPAPSLLINETVVAMVATRFPADPVPARGQFAQLNRIAAFSDLSIGWNLRESKSALHTLRTTWPSSGTRPCLGMRPPMPSGIPSRQEAL